MKKYIAIGITLLVIAGISWFIIERPEPPFKGTIEPELKLKASENRIINHKEVEWIEWKEDMTLINHGKIKKYDYISEVEVENKQGEDVSKRTHNARFYKIEKSNEWKIEFYIGSPFYKEEDKWYHIETATTSLDAWDIQTSLGEDVFGADYSAGSGDGYPAYNEAKSWATAQNADSGTLTNDTANSVVISSQKLGDNYYIRRTFLPFDTSAIDNSFIVTEAILYMYQSSSNTANGDNDGDDWVTVVQTNQNDVTNLVNADYNQCGNLVDDPTEGIDTSNRKDLGTLGEAENYEYSWTLNAVGRGWIDVDGWTKLGMREGHDVLDNAVAGDNRFQPNSSEATGTDYDPKLVVTATEPPTEEAVKKRIW